MLTLKIENNSYLTSVKNFSKKISQWCDLVGSAKMCNAGLEILVWNSIHAKEQWNYIFHFIYHHAKRMPLPSTCNCLFNSKQTHRLPNIWLSYLVVTQALSPWSSKKEGGKDDAAAVAFRSKNFSCKTFRTKERNWSVPWGNEHIHFLWSGT